MKPVVTQYSLAARLLHWGMALLLVLMLFVGVGMVSHLNVWQPTLVAWHKQLGLLLLALFALRLLVRLTRPQPLLPARMPAWQRGVAQGVHLLFYGLMLGLPLVGWAMQSAGGLPLRLGGWIVPPLLGENADLYGLLRAWHARLAYLLFALVLLHVAAALLHGLILRDGVLAGMLGRRGSSKHDLI